jgi:hypothetical protein
MTSSQKNRPMADYDKEKWLQLYHAALVELQHAQMSGRIKDARTEIVARMEKLHDMTPPHADERRAIADALNNLRVLAIEETHYQNAEEKKRAITRALEDLHSIAPLPIRPRKGDDSK